MLQFDILPTDSVPTVSEETSALKNMSFDQLMDTLIHDAVHFAISLVIAIVVSTVSLSISSTRGTSTHHSAPSS